MKTNFSSSVSARSTLAVLFCLTGIGLLCVIPLIGTRAQLPANPATFSGQFDAIQAYPCSSVPTVFTVPPGQARIIVNVNATVPTNDLAVTLLQGIGATAQFIHTEDNGVGNEVFVYEPAGGVLPGNYSVQVCASSNPLAPFAQPYTYAGTFTYNDTAVSVSCPPNFTETLPAAPVASGAKVGYENFEAPGVLTQITQTSSGAFTVEYLGHSAIEPSIGVNWRTGVVNYKSDLETLFVTFGANGLASWVNRRAPTSQFIDSDPIGFTDRDTGRVFVSELTLLSPDTVKISYTDNDGQTWVPDQTGGIASAVDHETIGGGPYHAPLTSPPPPAYPNAVYYCSQDLETALCSRSDDGGLTYGPSIPMYVGTQCGGLHGHVKVAPDGTVYVPNRDCSGTQSVVVSEDNGVTWAIRPVNTCTYAAKPSLIGQGDDPALSIDASGRVYFAFSNFGTSAGVAVSEDKGNTWRNMFDVGAAYGVHNVAFPTATAGDAGRAAVAFYGSTTRNGTSTGNSNDTTFTGVWHLYVAHTFDGGNTWTVSDATPTMPMQRGGLLRGGGADTVRNLCDFFDITTDAQGRVLVGYDNGCAGGPCSQALPTAHGNAYSVAATIARQSSGRRMLGAFDPTAPTSVPGMPFVTQRRVNGVVHLGWNEADTGNLPITKYRILRGISRGAETVLTNISGSPTSYDDMTATDPTKTYYYKVVAFNRAGQSVPSNEVAAPFVGTTCDGLIIHRNDPSHPEATGGYILTAAPTGPTPAPVPTPPPGSTVPQLLIDYIAVAEPPSMPGYFMFKMKVGDLSSLPPNSRWRIAWDYSPTSNPNTQMYYVGMATGAPGNAPTFEYGTLGDAGVPAILLLSETRLGDLTNDAVSHYDSDGTITMYVPKAAVTNHPELGPGVGNPRVGDLLGAIGGKTITGDTPQTNTLERSTTFVDHTFVKGNSDNSYPAATYVVVGNVSCGPAPTPTPTPRPHHSPH
ncbi:MAG: hypothetical protein ACJ8LV_01980 [Chthoniobacterales bacterium]